MDDNSRYRNKSFILGRLTFTLGRFKLSFRTVPGQRWKKLVWSPAYYSIVYRSWSVRPWLSTGELQQPCQLTSAGLKASKYVLANTIDFHEPKTKQTPKHFSKYRHFISFTEERKSYRFYCSPTNMIWLKCFLFFLFSSGNAKACIANATARPWMLSVVVTSMWRGRSYSGLHVDLLPECGVVIHDSESTLHAFRGLDTNCKGHHYFKLMSHKLFLELCLVQFSW